MMIERKILQPAAVSTVLLLTMPAIAHAQQATKVVSGCAKAFCAIETPVASDSTGFLIAGFIFAGFIAHHLLRTR